MNVTSNVNIKSFVVSTKLRTLLLLFIVVSLSAGAEEVKVRVGNQMSL